MRKAGAKKKSVKFHTEVEEHEPIYTRLLRENGSLTHEQLPSSSSDAASDDRSSGSRLVIIKPDEPGPTFAFKDGDKQTWALEHFPCRFATGAQQIEFVEIYEGADEAGCSFCSILLEASRVMLRGDPPPEAILYLRNDRGQGLHMSVMVNDKVYELELFRKTSASSAEHGKSYQNIPVGNLLPRSTECDENFQTIERWLKECLTAHQNNTCVQTTDPMLPHRVLSIGSEDGDTILLQETNGNTGKYACLSWCWGKLLPLRSVNANLAAHKQGILWHQLPTAFQDAIRVAQRLKIPHLWIDALCIIQDDKHDWEAESAKMAEIYGNAFVTICAAASTDSTQSLFRSLPSDFTQKELKEQPGVFVRTPAVHEHLIDLSTFTEAASIPKDANPIFYRAWTFQEMSLSPRVIFFRKHEISWRCQSTILCSCSPSVVQRHGAPARRLEAIRRDASTLFGSQHEPSIPLSLRDAQLLWHRLVECYSSKEITKSDDILPALSGIAKVLSRVRTGGFLAGLWEDNLIEDLCWHASRMAGISDAEDLRERTSSIYVAPTWSWASHLQPVLFMRHAVVHNTWVTIHEAKCVLRTLDSTGQVAAGHLHVTGQIYEAYIHPETLDAGRSGQLVEREDNTHNSQQFWYPDHTITNLRAMFPTRAKVFVLPIATYHGDWNVETACLVLRSCKTPSHLDDAVKSYERIGAQLTHWRPEVHHTETRFYLL